MYLQLADNYSYLAAAPNELYIFIPEGYKGAEKDMYIREDALDNLPEMEFRQLMFDLEPYQTRQMSGKAERAQRREDRKAKKATKGGAARRDARLERVKARKAGGGGFSGVLDKVGGIVSNVFGGGAATERDFDITVGPDGTNVNYKPNDGEESFFKRNQTAIIIGGVVVAGAVAYFTLKPKK